MTEKQIVLNTLSRLPESVSFADIRKEFEILIALNEAEHAIANGDTQSHEQVKTLLNSWAVK